MSRLCLSGPRRKVRAILLEDLPLGKGPSASGIVGWTLGWVLRHGGRGRAGRGH